MHFRKLLLLISLIFTHTANSAPQPADEEEEKQQQPPPTQTQPTLPLDEEEKRRRFCPGCKTDLQEHHFGHPHRDCTGFQEASSSSAPTGTPIDFTSDNPATALDSTPAASASIADDPVVTSEANNERLRALLKQLEIQEKFAQMKAEEQHLLQQIQQRQQNLRRFEAQSSTISHPPAPPALSDFSSTQVIPTMSSSNILSGSSAQMHFGTKHPNQPISALLSPSTSHPPNLPQQTTSLPSLAEVFKQQEQRGAELFLRPTKSTDNGQGKPLRIVDFVSRLRPTEEEKIITTESGSQTTLLLSVGNKKPKLENISVEEFSIANIRIFYELLTSGKLPSAADIRDYLSYSIKVLELARKYSWESVLKYDDEYRIVQHMYGYPWSYDQGHLQEVMLIPRWVNTNLLNSGRINTFIL